MRTLIGIWGGIAAVILLVIGVSGAGGSAPAQAQITPKADLSQVFVQMQAAQVDALRTLATAQLLTAQWEHVQACKGAGARWWDAMDCDGLLEQLEAVKRGKEKNNAD